MKPSKLIPALLISFLISENVRSQDTSIVNYFPLNVGNVWVYYCSAGNQYCYCSKYFRIKITDSIVINARRYYLFQYSQIIINCHPYSSCGYLRITLDTVRVDSVSGNVLKYSQAGCSYSPNEIMQDSLRARLNDSIRAWCSEFQIPVCVDTGTITIFGYTRQSRTFGAQGFEAGWFKTYARGFGITQSGYSSPVCTENTYLRGCVIDGVVYGDTTFILGITQISTEIPERFSLAQNYPNPFNPVTKLKFDIPAENGLKHPVVITVHDVLGREMVTLVNEQLKPGTYEVEWDAGNYPSGVYFYQLNAQDYTETKKMILMK